MFINLLIENGFAVEVQILNEEKVGIDAQIDSVRVYLNKLTDKNYIDMRNKIFDLIDKLIAENITRDDMAALSVILFEIASNNRFYSKMYAELYSDLTLKYEMMLSIFETNFDKEMILNVFIECLKLNCDLLENKLASQLWNSYNNNLFKKGIPMPFSLPNGTQFMGIIQEVNASGKLEVKLANDTIVTFGIKEIQLLY